MCHVACHETRQLWVFIFCAQNIFAYNKYFPERAMISRLATRSCVSGYTDWVFIEMWSMTNPFSSILATSPEPELFRPLSDGPLYKENQRGFKTVFYSSRVKYECTLIFCENHKPGSPVSRLAIPRNFTQISPVWILFGDKFALYVHDFVQTNPIPLQSDLWLGKLQALLCVLTRYWLSLGWI